VPATRYRCTACGNLTRFDVVTDRRTRAFHHYSVGGELRVDEEEVLSEEVVEVACRWCGHGRQIEVVHQADEGTDADSASHPSATLSGTTIDREPGHG